MAQKDIIRRLCEFVEDDNKVVNNEEYKKQNEEAGKWLELLDKYIDADKKLYHIFYNYDMAEGLREGIEQEIYFREGFLCGARLMLEICGYTNKIQ